VIICVRMVIFGEQQLLTVGFQTFVRFNKSLRRKKYDSNIVSTMTTVSRGRACLRMFAGDWNRLPFLLKLLDSTSLLLHTSIVLIVIDFYRFVLEQKNMNHGCT
jgi:hypothetical protein